LADLLGAGAMGTVYRGFDPDLGRQVAVKLMSPTVSTDPDLRFRFHREAQTAGSLQHPNIITVYEFGETQAQLFIAMEFVSGKDLSELIADGAPLNLLAKLGIGLDILAGLEYAHARGVTHRDIKPGNVRLTGDGRAKIMDFGIAHLAESDMTKTGIVLGTPSYMAPELLKGGDPSPASDIFSVGAVLYELLTLRKPFDGTTTHAVLYKVLSEDPDPVTDVDPSVPNRIREIVRKAMVKVPEDRYQTAAAMAADLKAACVAISTADDSTVVVRTRRRTLRGRAKSGFGVAVTTAGLFWATNAPGTPLTRVPVPTLEAVRAQVPARETFVAPDTLLVAVRDEAFNLRFDAQRAGVPIADLAEGDSFIQRADSLRDAGSFSLAIIALNNAGAKWAEAGSRYRTRAGRPERLDSTPEFPQLTGFEPRPGSNDSTLLDSAGMVNMLPPLEAVRTDASEIAALFDSLETAFEHQDVNMLHAVHPTLGDKGRTQWTDFFKGKDEINFDADVLQLTTQGDLATATVQARVSYTNDDGRQTQTWRFAVGLRRFLAGWRMESFGEVEILTASGN
jgi:ketosteroid isomerase-like protein